MKQAKYLFLKSDVTYLGQAVSEIGIWANPENTKPVKNWPVPKNGKEVREYLIFTGYYRRFKKEYTKKARPLNDLLVNHCTSKYSENKKKTKQLPSIWTES